MLFVFVAGLFKIMFCVFSAMAFPASGLESVYKANLTYVLNMLKKKHPYKYKIVNVSERRYDLLQLNQHQQVSTR